MGRDYGREGEIIIIVLLGGPGQVRAPKPIYQGTFRHSSDFHRGYVARRRQGRYRAGYHGEKNHGCGRPCIRRHIIGLVKARVAQPDCRNGFLFRWVPSHHPASGLNESRRLPIDFVIEIDVSDEEIIRRLSGRRVHPGSGRIYHHDIQSPESG